MSMQATSPAEIFACREAEILGGRQEGRNMCRHADIYKGRNAGLDMSSRHAEICAGRPEAKIQATGKDRDAYRQAGGDS